MGKSGWYGQSSEWKIAANWWQIWAVWAEFALQVGAVCAPIRAARTDIGVNIGAEFGINQGGVDRSGDNSGDGGSGVGGGDQKSPKEAEKSKNRRPTH